MNCWICHKTKPITLKELRWKESYYQILTNYLTSEAQKQFFGHNNITRKSITYVVIIPVGKNQWWPLYPPTSLLFFQQFNFAFEPHFCCKIKVAPYFFHELQITPHFLSVLFGGRLISRNRTRDFFVICVCRFVICFFEAADYEQSFVCRRPCGRSDVVNFGEYN